MANKTLFQTNRRVARDASGRAMQTVTNEAGGVAFALSPRQALAQYAATGCFSQTFYASANEQLDAVLALAGKVSAEFVAKVAVYARQQGHMKDVPALLCAVLSVQNPSLLAKVFPSVIDNGRMLRNFVQIVRSGAVGRRSLGSSPKRLVRQWLASRNDQQLVNASVGRSPSLKDILCMVHPKPESPSRSALYGWLCGREHVAADLPESVRRFESFKSDPNQSVPDVPLQMLTALPLKRRHWREIARQASWQTTRMNLNTFLRHLVFAEAGMAELVADRLRDRTAIRRSRVFPYQLMTAYQNCDEGMPHAIREALQDAMEIATENTPSFGRKVHVCVDVSGSMHSAVTGHRPGASSVVRCVDVAALFAACIVRRNRGANVLPFASTVYDCKINARDSIMTNAEKLASCPAGGTYCSAPLRKLNKEKAHGDLVVFVSDNESWLDAGDRWSTSTLREWYAFQKRNPQAKLVCIDIQPYRTVQAPPSANILHVGGFSDRVFDVVASFLAQRGDADHWVSTIEAVQL